jgi:hypothetical protein
LSAKQPDQVERPLTWARSETNTNIWSETDAAGGYVFRYRATVKSFIGDPETEDRPLAEKTVSGEIPRSWI